MIKEKASSLSYQKSKLVTKYEQFIDNIHGILKFDEKENVRVSNKRQDHLKGSQMN